MIAFLDGTIDEITEGAAIINVNGIGFQVLISGTTQQALVSAGRDAQVRLYTYLSVREDAMVLYGFDTRDELQLFEKLITVSGIGPKGALSLLSAMRSDDLTFAILSGDVKAISKAPGIGKKTAERLILELKDKIDMTGRDVTGATLLSEENTAVEGTEGEAIEALTALGYSRAEAAKAVHLAKKDGTEDETEALLKAALRYM